MNETAAPSAAAAAAETSTPSHVEAERTSSALDSMAPQPTNSEWASEICPAMPPTMFQADASAA